MNNICIYHGNCADGFGAAWVVKQFMDKHKTPCEFYPAFYQTPPPDVKGKHVIIVDFSYKRPVMLELIKQAKSVIILDHHKSAMEDLEGLDREPYNVEVTFDMEHSGCMLAWQRFFPGMDPPQLLTHLEDRDLWRFNLPHTRAIQASVFSYPYSFDIWDKLMSGGTDILAELVLEGRAIERKHFKDIREILAVATRPMHIGGFIVPVANVPYTMGSDAAHILCEEPPDFCKDTPLFAGYCWDKPVGREFGLRSLENGADVSAIAKLYGGGGHKHAAGFRVTFDQAREFELLPQLS